MRIAAAVAFALAVALVAAAAGAEPIHIHVRGAAVINAFVAGDANAFTLRGEVDDDGGTSVPNAAIVVRVSGNGSLEQCNGRGAQARRTNVVTLDTDERGSFCVTGRASEGAKVSVHFAATSMHDAAEVELPALAADDHRIHPTLRFDPQPDTIDLDKGQIVIVVAVRIERAEAARALAASGVRREGLALTLVEGGGKAIQTENTGGDGRARFEVKPADLGPPGRRDLTVRFDGNDTLAKATAVTTIVRRAEVRLALAQPIPLADAEEGAPIDVDVTSAFGPVDSGLVEALRGNDSIGTGSVRAGKAHLVVVMTSSPGVPTPVRLHYVPGVPWFRGGPALATEVTVAKPGILRQLALGGAVLGLAAWVVAGWRRAPPGVPSGKPTEKILAPSGLPGLRVVASADPTSGWRGTVVDAHDALPVPGAKLRIIAPAFAGDGVVAETVADEQGGFSLQAEYRSDARLSVESSMHSAYEQALPPPSVLSVALVTRRRALLDQLVRWARRQGAPFDAAPEPTPGHVRRAAARTSAENVEAWAGRVEHAAFGSDPVDRQVEDVVRSAEPRPLG